MSRLFAKKLARELWARKWPLLTLGLIVALGVGTYVGMGAVYRDLDGARLRYFGHQRLADFSVDLKRAPTAEAAAIAAAVPGVARIYPRIVAGALLLLPGEPSPISGQAVSLPAERQPVLNDILLYRGTWFSSPLAPEAIVNEDFARANHLRPGDRLAVILPDGRHDLLIVGTARSPEFIYLLPSDGGIAPDPKRFGVFYVAEPFLQRVADLEGASNQLLGLAHDTDPDAVSRTLRLLERHLDAYGVTMTSRRDEIPSVRYFLDEMRGIRISAGTMPLVFLTVAALLMNVVLGRLVVRERTAIGTLKALGYSTAAVVRYYMAFGLFTGVAGGLAGLAIGRSMQVGLGRIYAEFYTLPAIPADFHADVYLRAFGVSVLFALLGTIQAARFAARLAPAEAMRSPAPERGGRIPLERIGWLWRFCSFRTKLVMRNIFRNPFRTGVSVFATVIATSIILVTISSVDALDYLMAFQFERVSHEDFTVGLRDPKGAGLLGEFRALPGVARVEPQLQIPCDLSVGPRRKRLGVTGLPPGATLHTPLRADGRPLRIPTRGLVLSRKLADLLDVRPGDTLRFRPLLGARREVAAPVVALVDTYLGLSAYADLSYLSGLIGEEWAANTMLLTVEPGTDQAALLALLKQRRDVTGITERLRAFTQLQATFGETMGAMLSLMVLFAGAIAFGSVLNTALVSLSERRRDVASLRVLGYSTAQVAGIFSGESLAINAFGIAAGLFAGYQLSRLMSAAYDTELYRFPVVILPERLLQTTLLMILFIVLAQSVIYVSIRRMPWLDAMKIRE